MSINMPPIQNEEVDAFEEQVAQAAADAFTDRATRKFDSGGDLRAYGRASAQRMGIDPDIFERQIQQESGWGHLDKSGGIKTSPAGAKGIAQIVPKWHPNANWSDPFESLDYAANLMAGHLRKYGGDYSKALAAYNAGAGAVDKYGGVPPFKETQTYVGNILGGSSPAPASVTGGGRLSAPMPAASGPTPIDLESLTPEARAFTERALGHQSVLEERFGSMIPRFTAEPPAAGSTIQGPRPQARTPSDDFTERAMAAMPAFGDESLPINQPARTPEEGGREPINFAARAAAEDEAYDRALRGQGEEGLFYQPPPPEGRPAQPPIGSLFRSKTGDINDIFPQSPALSDVWNDAPAPTEPEVPGSELREWERPGLHQRGAPEIVGRALLGSNPLTAPLAQGLNAVEAGEQIARTAREGFEEAFPDAARRNEASRTTPAPGVSFTLNDIAEQAINPTNFLPGGIGPAKSAAARAATRVADEAAEAARRIGPASVTEKGAGAMFRAGGSQGALTRAANIVRDVGDDEAELAIRRLLDEDAIRNRAMMGAEPLRNEYVLPVGDVLAQGERRANLVRGAVGDTEAATSIRPPSLQEMPVADFVDEVTTNPQRVVDAMNLQGARVGRWQDVGADAWRSGKAVLSNEEALAQMTREGVLPQLQQAIGENARAISQGAQIPLRPAVTPDLASGALGSAVSQADTDEETTTEERIVRAALGFGAGAAGRRAFKATPSVNPGSPGATARAKLGAEQTIPPRQVGSWTNAAIKAVTQRITDDRVDLKQLQQQVERVHGSPLPPELRAAELDRLTGSSYWPARMRVQDELTAAYREAGDNVADLNQYLEAWDVMDKAASFGQAGINRKFSGGLTWAEAIEALKDLKASVSPAQFARIEKAADGVYDYVNGLRQRLVDSGVWDAQMAFDLAQEFPHYIPTNILDYMDDPRFLATGKKIGLADDGLRHLTEPGTERAREGVTASLARMAFEVERRAAKNETALAVHGWRNIDPALASLMRDLDSGVQGLPAPKIGPDEFPLNFFVNGELKHFAVNKALEPVFNFPSGAATGGAADIALKPFRAAASLTRITATERNPLFALAGNPLLDIPAYLYGQSAQYGLKRMPQIIAELAKAYPDVFKGLMRDEIKGQGFADAAKRAAVQFGWFGGGQQEAKRLARQIEQGGGFVLNTPADFARLLWDATPLVGARMENAPRLAAMRLADKAGVDPLEASMRYRSATMDFSIGGTFTKALNSIIPFFNVSTQAAPWVYRLAKSNPKGSLAAMTALVAAPTLAAEAWNHADARRAEAYKDVPDYVKKLGIVLMMPEPYGGVDEQGRRKLQYAVVPMRNFGPVVLPLREAAARAMGDDPEEAGQILAAIVGSTSPLQVDAGAGKSGGVLGAAYSALGGFMPTLYGTALQLGTNRNLFTGGYVASETADERATKPSQAIAAGMRQLGTPEARPSQVEFAIRDVGSGLAGVLLAAADIAAKVKDGEPLTPINPGVGEMPGVGGIAGRFVRSRGGQVDENLRDLRDDVRDSLVRELQALPGWNEVSGKEQDAAIGRIGEFSTKWVYGRDTLPSAELERWRNLPGFKQLSREEQGELLSIVRNTMEQERREKAGVR